MIKQQNIQQLFPNLQEQSYQTLQQVYENIALQEFHVLVQQIKTKFPIPNQINPVQFPTQENVIEFFQNYNPIILDLTHIQDVKIKLYKNAAFYGTLVDGLRQGQGILIKSTLQLYEGSFLRDKKDGIGFELLKPNQFYYGTYLNGLPHGEGVFWSKNQKYIGQWHQGKKHGIGWYQGTHSDYYLGQWENGRCFGLCIYINGDIYVGHVTHILSIYYKFYNFTVPMIQSMVMVRNILKMVITLLENIEMANLMAKVNSIGTMGISLKENLLMAKGMATGFGKVEPKKGQIHTKVNMPMIKNVDKEYLNMPMAQNMKAPLLMIKDVDMEKSLGKTGRLIRVTGLMDQWKEMECMNMIRQYQKAIGKATNYKLLTKLEFH